MQSNKKLTELIEKDHFVSVEQGEIIKLIPKVNNAKKIYLEITNRCNLDCTTCIRHSWDNKQGDMDRETFSKLKSQLAELKELTTIHFGGFGEPLHHPEFIEYARELAEMGYRMETITNGYLLDEKVARQMIDMGFKRIIVSLDAPEEESYNNIRVGSEFSTVIKNIEKLNEVKKEKKAYDLELGIEFVAMKQNYQKLPQLLKLADRLKAGLVIVTNLLPYSEDMVGQELYDGEDEDLIVGEGGSYLLFRSKTPEMKLRSQRKCAFVNDKTMTVTWEGNVSPCYAGMHNYHCYVYGRKKKMKSYYFGNVNNNSLKNIWLSDDYTRFRGQVKDFHFPSCTDCKYLDGCSMVDDNQLDCWGNSPTCADCLWSRGLILCP